MQVFVWLIIAAIVLGAISAVIAALIAAVSAVIGAGLAFNNCLSAFTKSIHFTDLDWEEDDEPAKRSYFFGPGYKQIKQMIENVYELCADSASEVCDKAEDVRLLSEGVWGIVKTIGSFVYMLAAIAFLYVVATILSAISGIILWGIIAIVSAILFIIAIVIQNKDMRCLNKRKIRSVCPGCKELLSVPIFICPGCGKKHKKLVPGPYGIWNHECDCGRKLPSTFMKGRSRLKAICPYCETPLVSTDARLVAFQLIGGSNVGKTVFLSSFFHQYLIKLRQNRKLKIEIPDNIKPDFEELEKHYKGESIDSTTQFNSKMYPLLIDSPLEVRRNLSFYDPAGETIASSISKAEIQNQFHHCDGFLFLIDPFSNGILRDARKKTGDNLSDFSDTPAEDVAIGFINFMTDTGSERVYERCSTPIAVLIVKADFSEVKDVISPEKIKEVYERSKGLYSSYEEARDAECRRFLVNIGMHNAVDNLEAKFSNLHYFPVSAMGHVYNGREYNPWGVTDAIDWMLPVVDNELADIINY